MPKLWDETIESHRRAVRVAILEAASALVAEHGLRAVTMAEIAERTGIGRATLYKYFPDVEAILLAWHERQIEAHLAFLSEVRNQAPPGRKRLAAVLEAYALVLHESQSHQDPALASFLHRDRQVVRARHRLHTLVEGLVSEGAQRGDVRDDVPPDELARYCLHALAGAGALPSKAAVRRLVTVALDGLRTPS